MDGSHKKANYSSPLDSSSVFWVSGHFLSATACSISGAASVAHAASWSPGAWDAVTVVDSFFTAEAESCMWLSGTLPALALAALPVASLALQSLSSLLFSTLDHPCFPEVSAPSCSPELFDPLAVAGYSLVLGVSALYTTSPSHPTRNKISKLNTQTSGCAHIGVSLTAGHSAQEEDPADCCLRETLVMFT